MRRKGGQGGSKSEERREGGREERKGGETKGGGLIGGGTKGEREKPQTQVSAAVELGANSAKSTFRCNCTMCFQQASCQHVVLAGMVVDKSIKMSVH